MQLKVILVVITPEKDVGPFRESEIVPAGKSKVLQGWQNPVYFRLKLLQGTSVNYNLLVEQPSTVWYVHITRIRRCSKQTVIVREEKAYVFN